MYQLQHKGASPDLAYQAYTQDQRYAGNSPDSASIGWKPGDPDPRAKPYNNVSSSNKSLESTNKKLESTSSKLINVFEKGTSKDEALAQIIEKFNGDVNKISGQKFAIGEDEYTVQRKGLSFEARGSNTSAQMKDDLIQYGKELEKINTEKTEALNESLKNDENWIEAQRNIAKQYGDRIDALEDRYGITVSEYRTLQAGGESSLEKFGGVVKDTGKELSTLPKIAFKAIENAFAPKQMGTGDPLSQDELNTLLRGMVRSNPSDISDKDWNEIVKANGGIEALARTYGNVIDETGRRIDTSSEGYQEYNKLLEKAGWLQDSLNEIYGDEIVSKKDAIKWIRAYNSQFDDTVGETGETEDNIKASRNLLEIYRKSTDLQTYYADAIGDGTYSVEEQTEVSERYADVLKYLKDMGIDATGALEGLPPALKGLVEAILNIINPVKTSSDSASPGSSSSNPTTQVIGKTSESSHQLFAKMQNDFKALNDQYKAGSINQSTYISKMKELSVHWDTVSRGPTIYKEALLGQDRQNAQSFIRMITEQFRLDYSA
ncbi:hypothetical protein EOM86_10320, partial [Candidatus Nomurabacteria bacterium]|nr:hypothetical protein [Candidatus Nomurabacteria bacterium]